MIDLEFIERLIRTFDASGVDTIEIERGGTRIRLAKTPPMAGWAPVPTGVGYAAGPLPAEPAASLPGPAEDGGAAQRAAQAAPSDLIEITSPMVGTFYRAPAPDAPPYVQPGSRVSSGDTLCIIEAMKLMNELECEVSGTIVEVCVENAQPVEYGQVLFRVDPR
ncbi:MAG TPA: acetyl-CoA carboxylase biotin carboxyl carrier protein [Longimicrobiales bacterium]|nr:acetyl-CoA carboxylase biotin carboxyl carrier protein [Longimicrobiales bacterium]